MREKLTAWEVEEASKEAERLRDMYVDGSPNEQYWAGQRDAYNDILDRVRVYEGI